MSLAKWVEFTAVRDARGQLVAAEVDRHIPFAIKRVYYLRDLKSDEPRGFHAHKALQQVAVCVSGSCTILLDDGNQREQVSLNDATQGLLIEPMVWHEMRDFSPNCLFMVFASDVYDEADYIRHHAEFLERVAR